MTSVKSLVERGGGTISKNGSQKNGNNGNKGFQAAV